MKSKIKTMKVKPEVTDEEISSFMNFDALLDKHEKKLAHTKRGNTTRNVAGGLTFLGIVILGVWYFFSLSNNEKIDHSSKVKDSQADKEKNIASKNITDNLSQEKPQEVQKEKIKSIAKNNHKAIATDKGIVKKEIIDTNASEDTAPVSVYIQAEPVNGYPALYEYFNRELTYPKEAIADSVNGVVTVVFNISKLGKPEKISIEQSLGTLFDKEAIRVIENMPAWKPATYNDKPVASKISLPLTFQIQKIKIQK